MATAMATIDGDSDSNCSSTTKKRGAMGEWGWSQKKPPYCFLRAADDGELGSATARAHQQGGVV